MDDVVHPWEQESDVQTVCKAFQIQSSQTSQEPPITDYTIANMEELTLDIWCYIFHFL